MVKATPNLEYPFGCVSNPTGQYLFGKEKTAVEVNRLFSQTVWRGLSGLQVKDPWALAKILLAQLEECFGPGNARQAALAQGSR